MAHAILAILLASAMAATLVGRRASSAVSQGRCPVQERGESPKLVTCRVWIKEIRPPALGPPGDSLDDLVR
jgi:hypothetical protein